MPASSDDNREERTPHATSWLSGALTPTAVLRSIALSLMDTADRLVEWLVSRRTDTDPK